MVTVQHDSNAIESGCVITVSYPRSTICSDAQCRTSTVSTFPACGLASDLRRTTYLIALLTGRQFDGRADFEGTNLFRGCDFDSFAVEHFGGFIAAQIPNAVWALRRIIEALWSSLQDITQHYRAPRATAVWLVMHGLRSST